MATNKKFLLSGLVVVAIIIISTVIAVGLSENPKKNTTIHYLVADDAGSTVSVRKGEMVNLTLQDYGDGGYTWSITSLDEQILALSQQMNWGSSGLPGDYGKDTWLFTASNTGTTTLTLECKQPWAGGETSQTVTFTVEVI